MRRFLSLLAAVAALTVNAAFAGSSWPQGAYDAQGTNFNRAESVLSARTARTLHVAWQYPGIAHVVISGSAVYGVTSGFDAGIVVINPQTGALTRTIPAKMLGGKAPEAPLNLAFWNGRLIVSSAYQVVALSPSTGKIFWRVPGGADELVVSGHQLFTGKGCQNVCGTLASQSIDLSTGRLLWSHSGNFGQAPVAIGGHLYQVWGEYNGHTAVYDPSGGSLLATMPIFGSWTGDAHHTYAYVLRGAQPGSSRASLKEIGPDGRARWTTDVGRAGDGNLVYAYGKIFTGSYRFSAGMVAVNASSGKVVWAANLGRYLHLAAANHLVVAANDQTGQISVVDAGSGRVLRQLTLPSRPIAVTGLAIAGGTIYVTDGSGLTAIRP
jgi:hypothetical protein